MPDHDAKVQFGGAGRRRLLWAIFVVWTAFVIYTMDIISPKDTPCIVAVEHLAASRGINEFLPGQVYHILSFLVWGALLAYAAAGHQGRLMPRRLLVCASATLLFASTTEFLQIFNSARSALVLHAVLNIIGGALGLAVWPALQWAVKGLAALWHRQKGASG